MREMIEEEREQELIMTGSAVVSGCYALNGLNFNFMQKRIMRRKPRGAREYTDDAQVTCRIRVKEGTRFAYVSVLVTSQDSKVFLSSSIFSWVLSPPLKPTWIDFCTRL